MTIRGPLFFLAGALGALGVGWVGFPYAIYESRPQPVSFSHKAHTEKGGMKCEDCHAFRDDGSFAGIPKLETCAACHAAPMGTTVAEKQFIDNYVTPQKEPQWAVYARQPEHVYFSHAPHVKVAKIACARCHGDEGSSATARVYQQDRISTYSRDIWGRPSPKASFLSEGGMKMDNCVSCHEGQGLHHSCLDCHK